MGDINCDGRIDSLDAANVLRHDVGLIEPDEESILAADVNRDGKVTGLDAALILKYDVGLIKEF